MWIYLDGRFVQREEAKVSVFDHGLLYGDGVFEGIRAYNGKVFRLEAHLDRLYDSAKTINLVPPVTKKEFAGLVLETLRKNKLRDAYLRPVITRGVGDLGLDPRKCAKPTVFIIATEWGAMYGDLYDRGLKAVSVSVRRNAAESLPPNAKTLNYLNNILAKMESYLKGGDEAIIFDTNGYLSEGSGDNIFVVKNGVLATPPNLNNLRGITQQVVVECAEELGIGIQWKNMGFHDLYTADEVFVTGTAAEVAPIVDVDGRTIGDGKPGPVTQKLMKAFREVTKREGTPI
ncbi:MAG TPA: branched-chain-amino-acid transaminase [Methanomicrobiales archaeon]|nr:branched-chain-amino-acid transaminase [Methanomicrobiales archaeon]